MLDLLDELTEIPFDIFWDKYLEIIDGNFNKPLAEIQWFYMHEEDRIEAFKNIGAFPKFTPFEHLKNYCK